MFTEWSCFKKPNYTEKLKKDLTCCSPISYYQKLCRARSTLLRSNDFSLEDFIWINFSRDPFSTKIHPFFKGYFLKKPKVAARESSHTHLYISL